MIHPTHVQQLVQVVYVLWVIAEIAIAATDLAEVIGSAVAMNLLFGLPIWAGVLITGADVLFIVFFGCKAFRVLEILIMVLCAVSHDCKQKGERSTRQPVSTRSSWIELYSTCGFTVN